MYPVDFVKVSEVISIIYILAADDIRHDSKSSSLPKRASTLALRTPS